MPIAIFPPAAFTTLLPGVTWMTFPINLALDSIIAAADVVGNFESNLLSYAKLAALNGNSISADLNLYYFRSAKTMCSLEVSKSCCKYTTSIWISTQQQCCNLSLCCNREVVWPLLAAKQGFSHHYHLLQSC